VRYFLLTFIMLGACGNDGTSGLKSTSNRIQFQSQPHMLGPGEQDYRCTYLPAPPSAGAIAAFRPVAGPGVHHVALFFAPGEHAQAEQSCWKFGDNWVLVAGAGVNGPEVRLPSNVALPLDTNGVYILQVHMLNASHSNIEVQARYELEPTTNKTYQTAGIYITGVEHFTIPAATNGYAVDATCQGDLPEDARLVNLFPHMHQLGVRFQAEHVVGGRSESLYDAGWRFDDQTVVGLTPEVALGKGDGLHVRCIYDNPNDHAVRFGEGTTDEMCFGIFYYYPAPQPETICVK
jgi:hypothetical protein